MAGQKKPTAIMPFGKYKGKYLQEIIALDPTYIEWLMAQPSFRTNNPNLVTIILSQGLQETKTPEHNKMQTLFLENDMCLAAVRSFFEDKEIQGVNSQEQLIEMWATKINQQFEENDWDVVIHNTEFRYPIAIELKPSIGDDYPAILRKLNKRMVPIWPHSPAGPFYSPADHAMVIVQCFEATGATYDQAKAMFEANDIAMRTLNEIRNIADS